MVASGKRGIALAAVVLLISRVKLDVSISAPLVFEEATAVRALERELIAVTLLVVL